MLDPESFTHPPEKVSIYNKNTTNSCSRLTSDKGEQQETSVKNKRPSKIRKRGRRRE
jgi:hypothetical protein